MQAPVPVALTRFYDAIEARGRAERLHARHPFCHRLQAWQQLPRAELAQGIAALEKIKTGFTGLDFFNLGTGKGYSVLEVIAAFNKAAGTDIPVKMAERRAGDVPVCCANADKARKELQWSARYGLEEMCKDGWAWYKKHPEGFRP